MFIYRIMKYTSYSAAFNVLLFFNPLMILSGPKTNTFTDEGRILQIEYAIKNVSNAPTMMGYVCKDGIVLLGLKNSPSSQREKIHKISNNTYCAISGIFADALQMIGYARVKVEDYREKYDAEISVKSIANIVGDLKQSFTIYGGLRPFGVSILYAGIEDNKYVLHSTNPSGAVLQWKGVCYGDKEVQLNNAISEMEEMNMKNATGELIRLLGKIKECGENHIERLEILHFSKEEKHFLTAEEIREYFNKV